MSLTLAKMIADARSEANQVEPADAAAADFDLIVDVREPGEFEDAHLPRAINIPRGLLELRADPQSPVAHPGLTGDLSGRILVYCAKGPGARSLLAAQTLASMGYEGVEVLGGGLMAWSEAGLPVDTTGAQAGSAGR